MSYSEMKTAAIFDWEPVGVIYYVVEGDYTDCHLVYLDGFEDKKLGARVCEITIADNKVNIGDFAQAIRDGAELIQCGKG